LTKAYDEFGDRRNPTILFLHGIHLGRQIWIEHARILAPRYHIVTLDLPGHGAMTHVPFTMPALDEVLEQTITEVCGSPPLIVGYSLGGFVAMQYASQRPDRTSGLVLSGCMIDFVGWKYWPFGVTSRLSALTPEPVLDALMVAALYMSLPRSWASLVSRIPFNRDVVEQINRIAASRRSSDEIASYRKPVLFLNGEYDVVFRIDEPRYRQALPQAESRVIHGVDHTMPMRRVQEFASAVGDFANRVFAAAPA
jgi:pimeloyl-ACP methyl ester carboxylesterase